MFTDTLKIDLKSINYNLPNEESKNNSLKINDDIKITSIESSELKLTYSRTVKFKYTIIIEFDITLSAKNGINLKDKEIPDDYFEKNFEENIGIAANYMSNLIAQITSTFGEVPLVSPPMFIEK